MFLKTLVIAGIVLATRSAAQNCLSATKFTANSIQSIATGANGDQPASVVTMHAVLDYDGDNKMVSYQTSSVFSTDAHAANFTSIQDFKHSKSYTYGTGFCNEEALTRPMFGPCLPANVTKGLTYTLADGQVTVSVYNMMMNGMSFSVHITDSGQPFSMTSFGQRPDGVTEFTTQLLTDVRMGVLSNPDLFQNHQVCHAAGPVGR